ncbi:SLC13 family permease [Virgibacillus necropolis]|uniref:Sodium-dependent dicarboxylate transporter SdcS n=1 Tax=Virgibacillus necropolis TaxID=163877 RepID=A0A221MGA0_9BACI|nr:SLC13 family permease [Virgibacillus necropolis]ASN06686.1 anion transporter [Virgibacillus necropolis]
MTFAKAFWSQMWTWNDQVKGMMKAILSFNLMAKLSGSENTAAPLENNPANRNKQQQKKPSNYTKPQLIGLFAGPALFILIKLFISPNEMSNEAVTVLASVAWVATWWVTEALPIPITSLLPLLLFPLTGVMETGAVSASYGDPLIFLFAGSFMIAPTMEKWNLHKRIALSIIAFIGTNPNTIILGFMVATAFLSMWISNTATTMMMVPISLAVTKQVSDSLKNNTVIDTSPGNFPFGTALMLGTAYSATIGGFGSLVGAPANIILAATVNNLYGVEISFARWMLFGVPMVIILIPIVWFYLIKIAFPMNVKNIPGGRDIVKKDLKNLGKMNYEEKVILTVFTLTALAWITRGFVLNKFIPGIDDTIIALLGGLILFLIPAKSKEGNILDWDTVLKLPWGILWLFGGGLALAAGIMNSGLDKWIGGQLTNFSNVPIFITIALIVGLITMLTEFTSNTATATMVYPIVAAAAASLGTDPIVLMVAACMGATFAFMFPVAAPPNAIVFATGYIKMGSMAKAGIWLNLLGIIFSVIIVYFYVPILFGGLM